MNKPGFARSAAFLRRRAGELVLLSASKAQDYFLGIGIWLLCKPSALGVTDRTERIDINLERTNAASETLHRRR